MKSKCEHGKIVTKPEGIKVLNTVSLWHTGPALAGTGPNWEQFRSAQVPSQLEPWSVELGTGPNWEHLA